MGFISNLFSGNSNPNIASGTNPEQLNTAYNHSQAVIAQQQQMLSALQAASPQLFQQQQSLADQLQQQSMGAGPNPAQAMLAQNTAANVAGQSAIAAGGRGASANAGMIQRQAAQQGAGVQQQAVGQAATLQAQQQLAAQQALMQQQGQMAGQQFQAHQLLGQDVQNEQSNLLGANANANAQNVSMANSVRTQQGQMFAGLAQGAGMALAGPLAAKGVAAGAENSGGAGGAGQQTMAEVKVAHGGEIPANGPKSKLGQCMKAGGRVPGTAKVAGDNLKNDTVAAKLSPGEVVIPRSVMNSADPAAGAAKFVQAIMAKHNRGSKSK